MLHAGTGADGWLLIGSESKDGDLGDDIFDHCAKKGVPINILSREYLSRSRTVFAVADSALW
jgi:hypothetical protein